MLFSFRKDLKKSGGRCDFVFQKPWLRGKSRGGSIQCGNSAMNQLFLSALQQPQRLEPPVDIPWHSYRAEGDEALLRAQYQELRERVEHITDTTTVPGLWMGGARTVDWPAPGTPIKTADPFGREDFIASAFYAHYTKRLIQAGKVLGEDVFAYEALYQQILLAFCGHFPRCLSQSEYVLALQFQLAGSPRQAGKELASLIAVQGVQMGEASAALPYLLRVLSAYGQEELAYSLLLQDGENGPHWLQPACRGSVADWLCEMAAGIQPMAPGFASVRIVPRPDPRLGWLELRMHTPHGPVRSKWAYTAKGLSCEVEADVPVEAVIQGAVHRMQPGRYVFQPA